MVRGLSLNGNFGAGKSYGPFLFALMKLLISGQGTPGPLKMSKLIFD